jgi:hypothetical protein
MRVWLPIAVLVVAGVLVVVLPRLGGRDDPHTPKPGHPETIPAAIALVYARGVEVGDTRIACGTLTQDAAEAVGCGTASTHPRDCGDWSVESTKILRFGGSRAAVRVGDCRIELVPGARPDWAISKIEPV